VGAEVTATASGSKHRFVLDLGADHVIDYRQVDFTRKSNPRRPRPTAARPAAMTGGPRPSNLGGNDWWNGCWSDPGTHRPCRSAARDVVGARP